jgi:uncharacterized protein YwqG
VAEIIEKIRQFRRAAWKPVTENRDGALTASKFSGKPWLGETESWPVCGICGKEMQLFIQLNLDHLPQELNNRYGSGLLQMFYCTNSDVMCEFEADAFNPFAKSTLLRVVNPLAGKAAAGIEIPSPTVIPDYFPAKVITGWVQKEDYPDPEETESLGLKLTDDEWDELADNHYPQGGDKLAGWPAWIQSIEYPDCPVCKEPMRLVFQIDSDDNLPYTFGDVGCGHITQSENQLDVVAFGWACT